MVGELPRALDISGQWIFITIQQNMKSSPNFEFREAVQFKEITVIEELPIKYGRISGDPPAAERI